MTNDQLLPNGSSDACQMMLVQDRAPQAGSGVWECQSDANQYCFHCLQT